MKTNVGLVMLLVFIASGINFFLGYITAPTPSIDAAWELIEEKINANEIYFAAEVESMVKQHMHKDIKNGYEYGLKACGRTTGSQTIITQRLLPHRIVVIDTVTFTFE